MWIVIGKTHALTIEVITYPISQKISFIINETIWQRKESDFMITVISRRWHISINRDGTPYIVQWDDEHQSERKVKLRSEDISVTEEGISYVQVFRGNAMRYVCPFRNLSHKVVAASLDMLVELGSLKQEQVQMHVLCFVYDFMAGVLDAKNPILVERIPLDIDALLQKYSELGGQIGSVDWRKAAEAF